MPSKPASKKVSPHELAKSKKVAAEKKSELPEAEKIKQQREEIVSEIGDMVYDDLVRTEKLLKQVDAEDIEAELARWDERQQKKWLLFSKYQESNSVELEKFVYLELKRVYMLVSALNRKRDAEKHRKQENNNGEN